MRKYSVVAIQQIRRGSYAAWHWLILTWRRFLASPTYQHWRERLEQYAKLCRLDKPIGIALVLWPSLWALWLASAGQPDLLVLSVFIAGAFLMRSAGCAINDFADRKFDAHVQRTEDRPIVTGKISPREALAVFAVLSITAFVLVLLLNRLTIYLSFVGVLLAALYPFAKRYTYLPQVVLGAAFGWAVPMAFAAQTGELPVLAWLLFVITLLWVTAYDTVYAMMDREDDIKIGVKSTAILFAEADVAIIGFMQSLVLLGLWLVGGRIEANWGYYLGWSGAATIVIYQYFLIRTREPQACFTAFVSNHYFGLAVFMGLLLHYLQAV